MDKIKNTFPLKIKVILLLGLIVMALMVLFYIPNYQASVREGLKSLLIQRDELPAGSFVEGPNLDALKVIMAKRAERSIVQDMPRLSAGKRIAYNLGQLVRQYLPQWAALAVLRVLPEFKNEMVIRFTLPRVNPDLSYQGRSVKALDVQVGAATPATYKVLELKYVSFFDEYDSAKLIAIFKEVMDDTKTPFPEKYNKLLDIATLAFRYYDSYIRASKEMPSPCLSAYSTFVDYLKFKKSGKSDFVNSDVTELIRCFLYDNSPLMNENRVNVKGLLDKLESVDKAALNSEKTYQIVMLMEKYAERLPGEARKQIVVLMVDHPEAHGRNRLKAYFLKAEPGATVDFLEGVEPDFFGNLPEDRKNQVALKFVDILYEVFQETQYASVKRQALITIYRMKDSNPDQVNKALQQARTLTNRRIQSTLEYLTKEQ